MKCKYSILLASTGLAAFLWAPSGALAQSAPTLGSAETFAILGASTVTCAATGGVSHRRRGRQSWYLNHGLSCWLHGHGRSATPR